MGPIVLAIDDDRSSQILMRAHLEDEQFCSEFIGKSNGRDALSYLQTLAAAPNSENIPNLILLDINMPEMSGWDFLEEIAPVLDKFSPSPAVILLSATNTAEDVAKAKSHAAVLDITTKPITNKFLNSLKQRSELRSYFEESTACLCPSG